MDNYNIRQDRPRLSSEEIDQRKDFDGILNDYQIIKKPFYKNPWFFGVTGMASVGLLVGATYSFTDRPANPPLAIVTTESVPAKKESKTIYLASLESNIFIQPAAEPKEKEIIKLKKKEIHDKTSTLKQTNTNTQINPAETDQIQNIRAVVKKNEMPEVMSRALQNHPKIDGKVGGELSVSNLSKNVAMTTDSDIPITGFEMHITTEFGSKVFRSNNNQLTIEMISAMKTAPVNTEVFFEAIKGQLTADLARNLQPLKFSLTK